jgi:sodium-dependent dicarboxylate transporter 2/3/5
MTTILKNRNLQLGLALLIGVTILMSPRPEGTKFKISGDQGWQFYQSIGDLFTSTPLAGAKDDAYIVEANGNSSLEYPGKFLNTQAEKFKEADIKVEYVDGLTPQAKRFLAVLAVLIFLFMLEPIPLEITAILIGVFLVVMQVVDVKTAWAPYMHPVVVFIMCCLIFAIALDKAGITKRLGHFIVAKAGTSVTKFTFIISIGLGLASSIIHDAAAVSVGIVTMLPLMRAAGIEPAIPHGQIHADLTGFRLFMRWNGNAGGRRAYHGSSGLFEGIYRRRNLLHGLDQICHAHGHRNGTGLGGSGLPGLPPGHFNQAAKT